MPVPHTPMALEVYCISTSLLESVIISGAVYELNKCTVYELNKSYDEVFIVIGGIYVVDAIVFSVAALLQSLRRRHRRRVSATATTPYFECRSGTRFPSSSDVHLTSVDATPAVTVPPLCSTYATAVAKAATVSGQRVNDDGRAADSGKRRNQTATTTAPSTVQAQ